MDGARRASHCEIYNEALYDLLRWTKQQLAVRWDAAKGFHVPDLFVKDCPAMSDMLNVRTFKGNFPCRKIDYCHPLQYLLGVRVKCSLLGKRGLYCYVFPTRLQWWDLDFAHP